MLDIGTTLRHYKRPEIQQAMVDAAKDREVAVKYGDKGFGKRPDCLYYPNDVLEFAKKRATSFHVSEEHWSNVQMISPELKRSELDDLRQGWDLVLDIDCPDWRLSRITTWLLIRALQDHNIKSISCKFSGNKGFHIGVPLQAFPQNIHDKPISSWFPEGPRRIASYLMDFVAKNYIEEKGDKVTFGGEHSFTKDELDKVNDKDILKTICAKCGKKAKAVVEQYDFACSRCGKTEIGIEKMRMCPTCDTIMEKMLKKNSACECGSVETKVVFDALAVIDVDTLLISSRHLYRMPYSLHEKSGLCSIPIEPDKVLVFEKESAKPENVVVSELKFLDSSNSDNSEATHLVLQAFDHDIKLEDEKKVDFDREFETLTEAAPAEFFPPCIHHILSGLEDGKKRSMFILINFLSNVGYEYDKIDDILAEWNEKNKEPLREVLVKGQVRYRRVQKTKVLPPNCSNKAYYKNFGVCHPDNFCPRIKNPVNYTVLKTKQASGTGKGRKKLTEEQKEMRRKFREKKKLENST